jgi:hypothetical protein
MMKQAVAILVGSLLVTSALIFHSYQRRYEGALAVGGLFVRLDGRTGKLSSCTLVESGTNTYTEAIIGQYVAIHKAAGFSEEEIGKWLTDHTGQMVCSPWND